MSGQEVTPFAEMSKGEQIEHLQTFHGVQRLSFAWSSYTKDKLQELHRLMHAPNGADGHGRLSFGRPGDEGYVPHIHSALDEGALTETVQAQLDALGIDKPLTTTQKKALLDLLNNDFATLSAEIDVFGDELLTARKKAIAEDAEAKGSTLASFQSRASDLVGSMNAEIDAIKKRYEERAAELMQEAEANNITPRLANNYRILDRVTSFKIRGIDERYREAEKETRAELAMAKNTLNRERLGAIRKIMLAAIPRDSAKLIDKMPDARSLMSTAQADRQVARQLEAAETK